MKPIKRPLRLAVGPAGACWPPPASPSVSRPSGTGSRRACAAPRRTPAVAALHPSLDLSAMDRSVNPRRELLHQFACGGWMKNNPIPDDQARWSVYAKVG